MQELGLIQTSEPTEEEYNLVEEPTDDELAEIEFKLDQTYQAFHKDTQSLIDKSTIFEDIDWN